MSDFKFSGEILCMGSINMDLVMKMEHLPTPGETVVTDNFNTYPGGKGGNQAVAASVLGGKVTMFSKLGNDDFSRQLITAMKGRGVDMTRVIIEPGRTAGIAIIRVDKHGQNSISFTPGSNAFLTPADVRDNGDLFVPGGILLVTMEISPETVYEAIRLAKEKGMFVILDPAPAPRNPFPGDIPEKVDIVKPNETEAAIITGMAVTQKEEAAVALGKLKAMGFGLPVITLGDKGIVALPEGEFVEVNPLKVESVDSTAAGDVFSGALAAALATGNGLVEALNFANVSGAISTTVAGAQTSIPDLKRVTRFLEDRR